MKNNLRLGRLAGVTIELNWSVLVIAVLITISAAGSILPAAAPGLSSAAYLTGGIIAAAALLGSILLHELGHALVARRHNVEVERISLWAFGGVAQLEGEATSPRAEAEISGIGPAISLALGALLFGFSTVLTGLPAAIFGWAGLINIVLAVFNLIPGAPLDGGRLLHAWLWKRHGDRARATATAGKAGRYVGSGLIGLGVFQFVTGGLGGLWTIFIGWFLRNAATAEASFSALRTSLRGVKARDIMTKAEPVTGDWMSVAAFVDRHAISRYQPFYLLAEAGGDLKGVVAVEALAKVPADDRYTTSVRTIARSVTELPAVDADQPAAELLRSISAAPLALVWDGPTVIGTISATQLAAAAQTAQMLAALRNPQPEAA